ncbi:MAG: hypothetical protein IT440_05250 [Phycisphaeraceae bacterium]|nr:hypothetical protein [Phycisphaeraceae bacterium]
MMKLQRDNFKAGLFVLFGILLALVVVYILADLDHLTQKRQVVRVFYLLSDGVRGLKPGAAVTLGDQPVGVVDDIQSYADSQSPGQVRGLVVVCQIPDHVTLHWDALIELVAPPLGSGTRLNIRSVGGQSGSPRYTPGDAMPANIVPGWAMVGATDSAKLTDEQKLARYPGPRDAIPGALAASSLVQDLTQNIGIKELQRKQIQSIIAHVEHMSAVLDEQVPVMMEKSNRLIAKVDGAIDKVHESLASTKEILSAVQAKVEPWSANLDAALDNTRAITAQTRSFLDQQMPSLEKTVANVQDTTANLKETSATIRHTTMQQVQDAMATAQAALESLKTTSVRLKEFVTAERPVLDRAVANAQIMSDQLKLAAIEIRRSPWRLLHAPQPGEMETDNLYDAARSFALAAGALDSASRSIESMMADKPADAAEVRQMLDHLKALFGRFQQAENTFWNELNDRGQAATQPAK